MGCLRSHSAVAIGIEAEQAKVCPVRAMWRFLKLRKQLRPKADPSEPLFPDWSADRLRKVLRFVMSAVEGVEADSCGTHSLRIGGATALYASCKDIDLVRRFGRWSPGSAMPWLYAWDVIPTSAATSKGMAEIVFELSSAAAMHRDAQNRRPWA